MTTEPSRKSPRALLAAIALAVDLPLPININFYDDMVVMGFRTVSDGLAWATHIGAEAKPYINTDGNRYLGAALGGWHGWPVSLNAHDEPADPLPADETAALTALAEGAGS